MFFIHRQVAVVAVLDLEAAEGVDARSHADALDAKLRTCQQHVVAADGVVVIEQARRPAVDTRETTQVHDPVAAFDGGFDRVQVGQIDLGKADSSGEGLLGGEHVQAANGVAFFQQPLDNISTEAAAAAGYCYFHSGL